MNLTRQRFRRLSKNKYGNIKCECDGFKFDSIKEKNRYLELKLLQQYNAISNLELQVKFELQESFKDNIGTTQRAIDYIADFVYIENGDTIIEDVKGKKTDVYQIKKKMFLKKYSKFVFKEFI